MSVLERVYSTMTGDNSERETPVSIPNTEVKTLSAEDTCLAVGRENRALPVFKKRNLGKPRFLFCCRVEAHCYNGDPKEDRK